MKFSSIYTILLIIILSSCSRKDEIIALSKGFFYSLSDSTYACPRNYYPYYDSLNVKARSDIVEIDESNISKQGDTVTVKCFNNYTTTDGTFKQDSVSLYLTTNDNGEYYISNSLGLVSMDSELKEYGLATGALSNLRIKDRELSKRYAQIRIMWLKEYFEVQIMLLQKVKIQNWSWETSYNGEAHGEECIVNNLDFAIDEVKYELTYYDYRGDFMAKDDGNISKKLYSGEKYNFTFWSSNAKNPDRANLRLVFPDRLVYKIIREKGYTGNEYQEYIQSLQNEKNK